MDHDEPSMPVDGRVSSNFGMRNHPVHGGKKFHHGMDIAAPAGTEIYPYRGGRVVFSGDNRGYGNMIIIDHGDGYVSRYAHNRVNLVRQGDQVDENTVIAEVGSTGISTGPHLHFEVRQNGRPMDPAKVLAMR
jgi:murein DD-endopeptidase MepM/ murein hydrolase activator NlpD